MIGLARGNCATCPPFSPPRFLRLSVSARRVMAARVQVVVHKLVETLPEGMESFCVAGTRPLSAFAAKAFLVLTLFGFGSFSQKSSFFESDCGVVPARMSGKGRQRPKTWDSTE